MNRIYDDKTQSSLDKWEKLRDNYSESLVIRLEKESEFIQDPCERGMKMREAFLQDEHLMLIESKILDLISSATTFSIVVDNSNWLSKERALHLTKGGLFS